MAINCEVVVMHPEGLHARPATEFVKAASQFGSTVEVDAKGQTVNAKSVLGLLRLGIRSGELVTLRASGDDEKAAIHTLQALLTGLPKGVQTL